MAQEHHVMLALRTFLLVGMYDVDCITYKPSIPALHRKHRKHW